MMSRDRSDTSESFGLRERTSTNGSQELLVMEQQPPPQQQQNLTQPQQQHHFRNLYARGGAATTSQKQQNGAAPLSPSRSTPAGATSKFLHRWVDWMQRQPVPAFLLPTVRRVLKMRRNNNDNTDNDDGESNKTLYCIGGLDRVVFGTTAAADCVELLGLQPPRYLWYMVSGGLCDILQLLTDVALHTTVFPHAHQAALCWMVAFCISILFRHSSHRYLVFGDYVPHYWHSLGRMYAGYSISIVLSTVFNYVITSGVARVSHYVAYVCTLLWTGLANYFILKRLWKMGGNNNNNGNEKQATGAATSTTQSPAGQPLS